MGAGVVTYRHPQLSLHIALVVWIGWSVFVVDMAYEVNAAWDTYLAVIWLAILIGAFYWTINV